MAFEIFSRGIRGESGDRVIVHPRRVGILLARLLCSARVVPREAHPVVEYVVDEGIQTFRPTSGGKPGESFGIVRNADEWIHVYPRVRREAFSSPAILKISVYKATL
jgi:hypothetical protein